MKIKQILEGTGLIRSHEGVIDERELNQMINRAMVRYNITNVSFQKLKDTVIDDYMDSDISQVTIEDIVQIVDASF